MHAIKELEKRIISLEEMKTSNNNCDVKIVASEEEIIVLARLGYDCQPLGANKWLMKRENRF